MDTTNKKKQVGFRLDENLVTALDDLSRVYPKLSLTDVVDLALKMFVYDYRIGGPELDSEKWLDERVGKYFRGEFDKPLARYSEDQKKKKK